MEDFELHLNSMELSTIVTKVDRCLSISAYGTVGAQLKQFWMASTRGLSSTGEHYTRR